MKQITRMLSLLMVVATAMLTSCLGSDNNSVTPHDDTAIESFTLGENPQRVKQGWYEKGAWQKAAGQYDDAVASFANAAARKKATPAPQRPSQPGEDATRGFTSASGTGSSGPGR